LLSRQGHGPTGVAGGRWQVARDRGGALRGSPIACGRLDRAISVQEPRLLAAEAAIQLPIFPAKCSSLVARKTRTHCR